MTEQPTYPLEERVKHIENFLFYGMTVIGSLIFITEERYIKPVRDMDILGDILILLALFILFFSYLFAFFYLFKVARSSGESTAVDVVNSITSFIEKNKSWLSYLTTIILILIISFVAKSVPGVEWKHIIPAILSATIIYILSLQPKIHKMYKDFRSKK